MHNYHKLKVYKKAIKIVSSVYQFTRYLPEQEKFGLTNQIRRASISITLNIAEGSRSESDLEFNRFLRMSLGFIYEVMSCLEICYHLKYAPREKIKPIYLKLDELAAMIHGLIRSNKDK